MTLSSRDRLVFALDYPDLASARAGAQAISAHVGVLKVGLELFVREGPAAVRLGADVGSDVFLDLKLHDIPATVSRAMRSIADLGVIFATVHCGETPKMLEAAVIGSRGEVRILGVTVLTSVSGHDIESAGFRSEFYPDLSPLVLKRARMARQAGCSGVVCSGLEAMAIKNQIGAEFITVTPGIRPSWAVDKKDDQQRVTTPAQAVSNGSDYLVIGRPIREAADPVEAARRVADEIEAVLMRRKG